MVWFNVDDNLGEHPKVEKAGLEAMGLWVVCGSHCARYPALEGFVRESYVRGKPRGLRLAQRLVAAGLWYPVEKDGLPGFQFHEWHENGQRTAEQVEQDKAANRARQQRYRAARNAVTNTVTNGVSNGDVTAGVSNGAQAIPSHSKELTPPTPPQNGRADQDNPPHRHEANALRALTALQVDRSLPLTVNELLVHAYRLGHGDPWQGYLAVKVATNFQLESARNPVLALRARLEAAT